MHDVKFFLEQTDVVKANLSKRNFDISLVDKVLEINKKRKELTTKVETQKAEVNNISKQVGMLKKQGQDASKEMARVLEIKKEMEQGALDLDILQKELNDNLAVIPNLLDSDVPTGKDSEDNQLISSWGEIPKFSFVPKDHVALGESLGMLDFERATKISGARFAVYKKDFARMERALINFMLDEHCANGYEEILPPFIVNDSTLYGTGQLPKFKDDLFRLDLPDRNWFLIPTAEVPVTNLKRDEIFSKDELPIQYTAYTPCFRSEAGSYGKDTKGLIRVHQFNKVELVNIVAPNDSKRAHEAMIKRACSVLEKLHLPYRAMLLCSGDIGFGAQKCVDLEVWLPGQNKFREISSISNCGEFQARRASIRFRNAEGKVEYAHTLNGSGLAVGRTLVAIVENYQNEDGSINIPEALQKYMGGKTVIKN